MIATLPTEIREKIETCLFAGQKIGAVKLYRDATPGSLAEAKAAMDELESQLRAEFPTRFTKVVVPIPMTILMILTAVLVMIVGSLRLWATHTGDVAAQARYQHSLSGVFPVMTAVSTCIYSLQPRMRLAMILMFIATIFLLAAMFLGAWR